MPGEIRCPACNRETLLLKEPIYEGFAKTGEELKCSGCGHIFEDPGQVPYVSQGSPVVFSAQDRSAEIHLFDKHEADHLCRYCTHYTVNPFMQWCGLHRKEVEATDTCNRFEPQPPSKEVDAEAGDEAAPGTPVF